MYHRRRYYRLPAIIVSCCLTLLLAACSLPGQDSGTNPTPATSAGSTTPTSSTGGTTPTPTTAKVPATQTDCPIAGTARAAVKAQLVLGNSQNILYTFNQGFVRKPTSGILRRYDIITRKKVDIVNNPNSRLDEAQLSQDGQWVMFTSLISGKSALQMVRVDGQGLQTLYCSSTGLYMSSVQWSPDMQSVIFWEGTNMSLSGTLYLLDIGSGKLQPEVLPPSPGQIAGLPTTWLDNTHVYMKGFVANSDAPPQSLYVLDTSKGPNQHVTDLQKVFSYSGYCLSFDTTFDNTKLFASKCNAVFAIGTSSIQQGPSTIISQPALGGNQSTVYSTPTQAVTTIRIISSTAMLLIIKNVTGDTSKNGLWKMNLDGTGLARLITTTARQSISLNYNSQYTWSNISRDNSMYVLQISGNNVQSLLVGSLNANTSSTFASFSGDGSVNMVGWTRL